VVAAEASCTDSCSDQVPQEAYTLAGVAAVVAAG